MSQYMRQYARGRRGSSIGMFICTCGEQFQADQRTGKNYDQSTQNGGNIVCPACHCILVLELEGQHGLQ